ncbi:hypothetical protein [Flavivirga eckloniae]|uniref:Lipoprotein n=1 Tax=Flavivirga eckloniae TaxID=1803846 RepID=A0A2K9PQG6_9FLAO|nr:hypothetical protein [Flavivirga eckloniae]AUP79285.1 hypothetical protein C1H87_11445 [Flavivirga eckloniae]
MKSYLKYFMGFACFISLIIAGCSSNDDNASNYENELEALSLLKADIEGLANESVCNDTTECKFIALGSKPCGGPWSYLVYTTSIDVAQLEAAVRDYNKKEAAFNIKWNINSECEFALQPTNVSCENNTCILIY